MSTLSNLQHYMTGRKMLLPVSLLLSGLSAVAGMVPFILIWFIIRELFVHDADPSFGLIRTYAWWAAGMAIASIALYFLALSLSHLAAFRVEVNIRKQAMAKIVKMPLGFFDAHTTGKIRKIIDDNAGITHSFLAHQMPDLASTIIMPLTAMVLIFVFNWQLGLVCLVPILGSMLIMSFAMGRKGKEMLRKYMKSLEDMNTEAVEYVRGIPVVKVFQQTVYSFKNFHKSIMEYKNFVVNYTLTWEKPMSAYIVIINSFTYFLIPVAILVMNASGNYATVIVDLFLFVLITTVFAQSIMRSMFLVQAMEQTSQALSRLEELTDYPPLSVSAQKEIIQSYDVTYSGVSYTYPGANAKAIDGVSFSIPSGKTVALVGASGGGKTTIARLLPRFRDVDEGEITIGEINVKNIDQKELMRNITFVFQNTRLFKTSLLENIRYGNPSATQEEIQRAVDLAQCREIINKQANGLETKIGTEGTYLSGGEQQRLILARAILKNAPIVVLDEATAFTDPENEHLIQQAFKKLTQGKTVLMIAHRLTSVTDADAILVINNGKIAEKGTHQELLTAKGVYAGMWKEYQQSVTWTIGKEAKNA
jgi:ATP-binding cassette, subfamily B, bacterial IrtA/YbtP